MRFVRPMKEVEVPSSKLPPVGDYVFIVLEAIDKLSSKFFPMIEIHLDIDEGEYKGFSSKYPLKTYQVYETDEQYQRLKTLLSSFQKSNPDYITQEDIESDNFDEKKLIGLLIGGSIKHEEYNGKMYAKINWLFSTERIRPEVAENPETVKNNIAAEVDRRSQEEINEEIPF